MSTSEDSRLFAYEIHSSADMPIRSAPLERDWMDGSPDRFAYRCLPLTIANQAGWLIENPVTFRVVWDGTVYQQGLQIRFGEDPQVNPTAGSVFTVAAGVPAPNVQGASRRDARISSHFGCGIVTFSLPYLFRTPPSVNLWVKGPTNYIKDGAQALEGIVETDWNPATFTMNWKLTRSNYPVRFERGEPIAMIVPVPRGFAEGMQPVRAPLSAEPELREQYLEWRRSRDEFLAGCRNRTPEIVQAGWQRHYTKGTMPGGGAAPEHQTRLRLREFVAGDGTAGPAADERATRP